MILLACLLAIAAKAEVLPPAGGTDARIRTVAYGADQVYRLFGYVGYHLDLEFEADETFEALSGGDLDGLTYSAHGNVLTLKPKVAATEMNLAVTTSKRRYYFEYSASARRPSGSVDPVMYAVRFSYPKPPLKSDGLTDEERLAQKLEASKTARPRNSDYWYCGDKTLKPVGASDDGVQTRLSFAPRGELPAVFVRNDDGSESLLNFSIDEGDVLIHRIAARFIVRRGKLTGCIVNQGFKGGGERLKSGTVTPDVTRERLGVHP
jgi:type IV secretion system protein VirB9